MQELNQDDHQGMSGTRKIHADTEQKDLSLLKDKLNLFPGSTPKNKLLFIEGSSSYAIELVMRTAFPRRKAVLILDNGPACIRLKRIAAYLNIPYFVISLMTDPDAKAMERIRKALQEDSRISGLLMSYASYQEKSYNEIEISQISKKYNRILIVDNTLLNSVKPGLDSLHFDYLISTLPLDLLGGKMFSYIMANYPRLQRLKKAANHFAAGPV